MNAPISRGLLLFLYFDPVVWVYWVEMNAPISRGLLRCQPKTTS